MDTPWHEQTALSLGQAIGDGRIDPVELTDLFLDRIGAEDPDHAIYVRLTADRARAEAMAARDRNRRGMRLGPLDGVPISWKDLFDTAGVETNGGTELLAGRVPDRDAELLARATRAGLVCLGKTGLPDLAFSGLGINPYHGTPRNPFDDRVPRVPGGSSAGAAVSVARGLAAAAIGSDTGGSVRIPAAWNGLVGLKTTAGLLPLDGVIALSPTLDTVGPLTRDVADANALLAVLARRRPADLGGASLDGVRLCKPQGHMWDGLDTGVADVIESALDRLVVAGGAIVEAPLPEAAEIGPLVDAAGGQINAEGYGQWRDAMEAAPAKVYRPIYDRFRGTLGHEASAYAGALIRAEELKRAYAARTAGFTAVVAPTVAVPPPPIAPLEADAAAYAKAALLAVRNTRIGNLLGLCAITLPCGLADGLPVGLMFMAPPFGEGGLLRLASAAEQIMCA